VRARARDVDKIPLLLQALGIDPLSFQRVVEWTLCEHLVAALASSTDAGSGFFDSPDAMKRFRRLLEARTRRAWSPHDLEALFERVKTDKSSHQRRPVPYEEYLKLLWQVPLECIRCRRRPPDVVLHVDHIVPASRGGSSKRPNLQFLCAEDNLRKSNRREVSDPWLNFQ
jgi:hypothetical protein